MPCWTTFPGRPSRYTTRPDSPTGSDRRFAGWLADEFARANNSTKLNYLCQFIRFTCVFPFRGKFPTVADCVCVHFCEWLPTNIEVELLFVCSASRQWVGWGWWWNVLCSYCLFVVIVVVVVVWLVQSSSCCLWCIGHWILLVVRDWTYVSTDIVTEPSEMTQQNNHSS